MNWKYFKNLALLTFTLIILFSCKKQNDEDTCLSYTIAPITNITGANSAGVNEEIELVVYFGIINGCGQFGNIEETTTGNTSTIKVNAKYEGCVCTQVAATFTTIYKFKKAQPGTYELKFWDGENSYLTHTIVVE